MWLEIYRALLRLPRFKGRGRLEHLMRERCFKPEATKVSGGFRMELDPREWIQVDLLARGELERPVMALLQRVLKPGDVFVDVGAHVGYYSLLARTLVGDKGRVLAIDPQPYNAQRLLRNAELNAFTNLEVHIAAAGEQDQFQPLSHQRETDKARLSLGAEHVNDLSQKFIVPTRRLDTLLREAGANRVRLMKLDVIGFELEVVRGLGAELGRVENLLVEVLDTRTPRSNELISLLHSAGYLLCTVTGEIWEPGQPLLENNLLAVFDGKARGGQLFLNQ